jgi:hypothetical protein
VILARRFPSIALSYFRDALGATFRKQRERFAVR